MKLFLLIGVDMFSVWLLVEGESGRDGLLGPKRDTREIRVCAWRPVALVFVVLTLWSLQTAERTRVTAKRTDQLNGQFKFKFKIQIQNFNKCKCKGKRCEMIFLKLENHSCCCQSFICRHQVWSLCRWTRRALLWGSSQREEMTTAGLLWSARRFDKKGNVLFLPPQVFLSELKMSRGAVRSMVVRSVRLFLQEIKRKVCRASAHYTSAQLWKVRAALWGEAQIVSPTLKLKAICFWMSKMSSSFWWETKKWRLFSLVRLLSELRRTEVFLFGRRVSRVKCLRTYRPRI